MKIKLNCIYGDNYPDDIVQVSEERGVSLIADGNAFFISDDKQLELDKQKAVKNVKPNKNNEKNKD